MIMNKKLIRLAFAAAFVAIAGYGIYANQKTDSMSELMLANVEALANDETLSGDCDTYCEPDNSYTCFIIWGEGIDGVTCPGYRKKR